MVEDIDMEGTDRAKSKFPDLKALRKSGVKIGDMFTMVDLEFGDEEEIVDLVAMGWMLAEKDAGKAAKHKGSYDLRPFPRQKCAVASVEGKSAYVLFFREGRLKQAVRSYACEKGFTPGEAFIFRDYKKTTGWEIRTVMPLRK
jgi:hypothetical protein